MRAIFAAMGLALAIGTATAQTFVPRFDRPMAGPGGSSRYFEPNRSDLETSLGRVAEAPKLMPAGASASTAPDTIASPVASAMPVASLGGVFVALLALGALGWRLRGRPQGLHKG